MLNQGPRPTFGEMRRGLEVHLFGVNQELYGQWVRVEWVERLRDVMKFASVEQFKDQLERDRASASDALARHAPSIDSSRASHA
jgi:riboflavin kinase/FMN adenylyltransferase